MIFEGDISIPYKWTTGPTTGRFLGELKDNARIVGAHCSSCGRVYVPPPEVCTECFKPISDWVPLSGEGTLVATSVVERTMPWSPSAAPYTLALIKLDGADTNLIHLVRAGLKRGDRVRAAFKTQKTGALLDIEYFESPRETVDQPKTRTTEPNTGELMTEESYSSINSAGAPLSEVGEVFKALPGRFRSGKVDKRTAFYFSIDEEKWTVIVESDQCSVTEGKTVEEADCFLKTSAEIFLGTIRGTYTPGLTDLVSGKVKTNNPFLLQTFKDIFG